MRHSRKEIYREAEILIYIFVIFVFVQNFLANHKIDIRDEYENSKYLNYCPTIWTVVLLTGVCNRSITSRRIPNSNINPAYHTMHPSDSADGTTNNQPVFHRPFTIKRLFIKQWNQSHENKRQWTQPFNYIAFSTSFIIGLSSVAEFTSHSLRYGSVVYAFYFFFVYIIVGIPLLYMEMFIGQFTRKVPVQSYRQIMRGMYGFGWVIWILSFYSSVVALRQTVTAFLFVMYSTNSTKFLANSANEDEQLLDSITLARSQYSNATGVDNAYIDHIGTLNKDIWLTAIGLCAIAFLIILPSLQFYPSKITYFIILVLLFVYPLSLLIVSMMFMHEYVRDGLSILSVTRTDWMYDFHILTLSISHVLRTTSAGSGTFSFLASLNSRRRKIHTDLALIVLADIFILTIFVLILSPSIGYVSQQLELDAQLIVYQTTFSMLSGDDDGILYALYPVCFFLIAKKHDMLALAQVFLPLLYLYMSMIGVLSLSIMIEYQALTVNSVLGQHFNTRRWISKLLVVLFYTVAIVPLCCKGSITVDLMIRASHFFLTPIILFFLTFLIAWLLSTSVLKQWLDRNQHRHPGFIVWLMLSSLTPVLFAVGFISGPMWLLQQEDVQESHTILLVIAWILFFGPIVTYGVIIMTQRFGNKRFTYAALRQSELFESQDLTR